jgi:hypothetical protein
MCHTSLCDKAEQSDISVKVCTNRVEWGIRQRGAITHNNSQQYPYCHTQYFTAISLLSQTILHSNIPTVTYNTSQQYPYCHTQYFTAISLPSHTIPDTTVCRQQAGATHQNSLVHWRTAKTTNCEDNHGSQYRLQYQNFYVMFWNRYSCGGADQLVLSNVLGTLDSGPSTLPGITEYEMLLSGWL